MKSKQARLDASDLQQLYQYAMTLCQNPDSANDLLQSGVETFLSDLARGKPIDFPLAYVRRVIRNRFIDRYRYDQRWQSERFVEQEVYDISPIDLEQLHIDQQILQQLWSEFAPSDRDILYHWAILGHSTDEACKLLDMPRGTFLSRIRRLRQHCTNLMESRGNKSKGECSP